MRLLRRIHVFLELMSNTKLIFSVFHSQRMNCPPTKRLRRLNDNGPTAMDFDDPFGDDEDFTQDDLDEIDVIASQAFPQGEPSGFESKLASYGTQLTHNPTWSLVVQKPVSRPVASCSRENTFGFSSSRGTASREPLGNAF